MTEEADSFRSRAKQCRTLAASARHAADRQTLNSMADDLSAEADKIDAEEAAATSDDHVTNSLNKLESSLRLLRDTDPRD